MKRRKRADDSRLLSNSLDSISDPFSLPTSQDILSASDDPFWLDTWHFNQSSFEPMDNAAKQACYNESMLTSEYITLDQDLEELPFLHKYFMDPDNISKLENSFSTANGLSSSHSSSPPSTSFSSTELLAHTGVTSPPNENSSMSLFNDKLRDLAKHSPKVTETPLTLGMRHLLYQYQQTVNLKDPNNLNQESLDGKPFSYDLVDSSSNHGISSLGIDMDSGLAYSSHSEDVDDPDLDGNISTPGQYSSSSQNPQAFFGSMDDDDSMTKAISSDLKGLEPSHFSRPSSVVRILIDNRPKRSKWTSYDRIGQEELYSALENVLQTLKSYTPHVTPFLVKVNKRDVPDYYTVIKKPMDIGSMTKKLKHFHYTSKSEFIQDIEQIVSNAFAYNEEGSIYRVHAAKLNDKAKSLFSSIPDITIRSRAELRLEKEKDLQNIHISQLNGGESFTEVEMDQETKEEFYIHPIGENAIQNENSEHFMKSKSYEASNEHNKASIRTALVASLFQEPFIDIEESASDANNSAKSIHSNVNALLQIDALGQWLRWKRLLFREALMRVMCLGYKASSTKKVTGKSLNIFLQRVSDYMQLNPHSSTVTSISPIPLRIYLSSNPTILTALERYLQQTWCNEFPRNNPNSLYFCHTYMHAFSLYSKERINRSSMNQISSNSLPSANVLTFFGTLEDVQYCSKLSAYLETPTIFIPPAKKSFEITSSLLSSYSIQFTSSKISSVWLQQWTSWLCFYLGFDRCSNETLKTFASLFAHIFEKITYTLASYLDYYPRCHPQAMHLAVRLLLRDSGQNQFSKITTSSNASVPPELGALQTLIAYQHWFFEVYPRKIKENKRSLEKQMNYYLQGNPSTDRKESYVSQHPSQSSDQIDETKEETNDSISLAFLTGQLIPQDDLGLDWLGLKELGLGDISIPSHLFRSGSGKEPSNSEDHLFEKEWAGVDPSSDLDEVKPTSKLKEDSVALPEPDEEDIANYPRISHSYIDFEERDPVGSSPGNDFPSIPDVNQMDADSNSVDSPTPPLNIPFLYKGSMPSSSTLHESRTFLPCTLPPLEKASTFPKLVPLVQPYYSNILFHDDENSVIDESQCLLFNN